MCNVKTPALENKIGASKYKTVPDVAMYWLVNDLNLMQKLDASILEERLLKNIWIDFEMLNSKYQLGATWTARMSDNNFFAVISAVLVRNAADWCIPLPPPDYSWSCQKFSD